MSDTLTALDATFLELEQHDEGALMHIGGVMVFEAPPEGGTPTMDQLLATLESGLLQLPRYSQRLSATRTGGLAWPQWIADDRFRLQDHVVRVALPAPGGRAELLAWVGDFYSHRLDRTRPLWELALIEGLADGGWALAHKTHHCLVDGVGSVDVGNLLLDQERNPRAARVPSVTASPPSENPRTQWPFPAQAIANAAHAGAGVARAGLHAAMHPGEAWERSRSLTEVLVRDELIGAPHTSLNLPIGSSRRFAAVSRPLAEVKAAARGLGGSVNDAVLAACTTGLRDLLLHRGEELPPRGLRAMVPMNVRQSSERLMLGNRVSSLFVALPVATADPHERHRLIVEETVRLKSSGAAMGAQTAIDLAALAPPVVHAAFARSLYATRLFNLTITNVPGAPIPLYAFGSQLREVYPVVPLAAAHAVGIAIFSYNGVLTFGVIADRESTPDIDVLVEGIDAGIEELVASVGDREQPVESVGDREHPVAPVGDRE
jgi:diacylglycerol O-acyltransferase / wax synthase